MVTRFLRYWSRAYVLHLEEEILWLRGRLDLERKRAEVAIDNLVSVRVNVPVQSMVQPARPEQAPDEIEAVIRRLAADPEFAQAGNAE